MTIYYCVTIDTEEEWDWDAGWPTETPSADNIAYLPEFQDICTRHGAASTYFVNHAVFQEPTAEATLKDFASRERVEIGMHIHPWNTPPMAPEPPQARDSFVANLDDDLAYAKLQTVYDRLQQIGVSPTSFRGGRYSSGGTVHKFLRDRGFIADASVVPFTTWDVDGAPDYTDRGQLPVRLQSEGEPPLWELPLSLGFTRNPQRFWANVFRAIETTPLRHLRMIGIAERLNLVKRSWLNFEADLGYEPEPFLQKVRELDLPYVCFTLHSSSLLSGGNIYTRSQEDRDQMMKRTAETLQLLEQWDDFQPATISQIAQHLERDYHENSGN